MTAARREFAARLRSPRRAAAFSFFATVCLGLVAVAGPAMAADPEGKEAQKLSSKIEQMREEITETSKELSVASARLRAVEADLGKERALVRAARQRVRDARARERALAGQLREAEAAEARALAELRMVEGRMNETQYAINALARSAYQRGLMSEVAVYLQADTPEEASSRMVYSQSAVQSQDSLLERIKAERAQVEARRAELAATSDRLAGLRAEAQANLAAKRAAAVEALEGQRKIEKLAAAARAETVKLEREKAREEDRLAEMEAEARALQDRLRGRVGRGDLGSPSASGLIYPVNGPITSPFGMRTHPVTGVYKLHDGTDFGGGCGQPVRAATDGRVLERGYSGAWGNRVVVEHGSVRGRYLASGYNHLASMTVSPGERVSQGQVVGYVGTTGYSTGCHLHFNLYVNGSPVNPMSWL